MPQKRTVGIVLIAAILNSAGGYAFAGSTTLSTISPTINAAQFSGANYGARIQNALKTLPAAGGVVDARGITGEESIRATVTIPEHATLLLGKVQITSSQTPAFRLSNDAVLDCGGSHNGGASVTLVGTRGGSIFSLNGAHGSTLTGCAGTGVSVSDGSIGIDVRNSAWNMVSFNSIKQVQIGEQLGGPGGSGCDCYNLSTMNQVLASTTSYLWGTGAAANKSIGDQAQPGRIAGRTGFQLGGCNNTFILPDIENSGIGIEFQHATQFSSQNHVINPYLEAWTTAGVQFDDGVCGNILTGGGVNVLWQGTTYLCNELDAPGTPTGGAHFASAEIFTQPGDSRAYEMLDDGVGGTRSLSQGLQAEYNLKNSSYSGAQTYVPIELGTAVTHTGIAAIGSIRVTKNGAPNPPTVGVCKGATAGSGTCSYALICVDGNQQKSAPSPFASISNCPARLDTKSCVDVSWNRDPGCARWDILKGDPSHSISTNLDAVMFQDAGQASSAYVPSERGGGGGLGDVMLPQGALVTNNSETIALAAAVGANPALEFQQNGGANADTFVCRRNADSGQSGYCFDVYTTAGSFLAGLDVDGMFQTAKFNATARAIPACKEPLQGKIASVTDSNATALGATYNAGGKNYALVVCNGKNWTILGR
jgi:hypothetical protein